MQVQLARAPQVLPLHKLIEIDLVREFARCLAFQVRAVALVSDRNIMERPIVDRHVRVYARKLDTHRGG